MGNKFIYLGGTNCNKIKLKRPKIKIRIDNHMEVSHFLKEKFPFLTSKQWTRKIISSFSCTDYQTGVQKEQFHKTNI